MAAEEYEVMTSKKAKALLAKKGILMPWQEGADAKLAERNPNIKEQIAEISSREEKALEDAQVKKVKKAIGKAEGEVAE